MTDLPVCSRCDEPAIVGYGEPPEWLCAAHFDEHLADLGARLAEIQQLLAERRHSA